MDLFGFKKRRKQRHENILKMIPTATNEFLKTGHDALQMDQSCGMSNEYTGIESRAIYDELDKRGLVDELGYIK